jgi:hypothetical protein
LASSGHWAERLAKPPAVEPLVICEE